MMLKTYVNRIFERDTKLVVYMLYNLFVCFSKCGLILGANHLQGSNQTEKLSANKAGTRTIVIF